MVSDVKVCLKSVPLESIDLSNQTYRISNSTEPGFINSLANSITQLGMLQPPLIVDAKNDRHIVSGFRRLEACRRLNKDAVLCRLVESNTPSQTLAQLAIAENSWHRPLALIEKARALKLLQTWFPDPKDLTLAARPLGIVENAEMIAKLISLAHLAPPIQKAVENGSIGLAMALALGLLATEDADKLLDLFCTFRFGLNRQREFLQNIEEIAKIESTSISRIIMSDDVISIINRTNQDRPTRGNALRRYLKQRRYPALTRKERAFSRLKSELKLGPQIRFNAPAYFEDTTFQLLLSFDTLEELNDHQQKLDKISRHPLLNHFLLK